MVTGLGFDLVGNVFHNERFLTKGGDSLFHMTRTGLLPGSQLGVVVFANMEQHPLTGAFVNAIRNGLLQIFNGVSEAEVWSEWNSLSVRIQKAREACESFNVHLCLSKGDTTSL